MSLDPNERVEGIFWISGTTSPYPIVYQGAGAALVDGYPGTNRLGHDVKQVLVRESDRKQKADSPRIV